MCSVIRTAAVVIYSIALVASCALTVVCTVVLVKSLDRAIESVYGPPSLALAPTILQSPERAQLAMQRIQNSLIEHLLLIVVALAVNIAFPLIEIFRLNHRPGCRTAVLWVWIAVVALFGVFGASASHFAYLFQQRTADDKHNASAAT